MKSLLSSFARFRSSWPIIGLILAVSAVLIGAVLLLHFWKGIPIGKLTRDPTAIGGTPPYTYQWDDPLMQTTRLATDLPADTHSVVITDANGCVNTFI